MKRIFLSFYTLLFIVNIHSQNWTGNVNSDWNNPANWSAWPLNGAPVNIDPANYSGAAASPVLSANSAFSPAGISIQNGAVLTLSANLTTQDDVEAIGTGSQLIVTAGTFSINPGDGGRLIIDLGSSMTVNGGNVIVDERFIAGENSTVLINNGTISSGERLIGDLGGQFIQNGGTVNVAAVFAFADGSAIANSGYTLNNGILNVSGEMALENEAGNFAPFFIQNNGTFNMNGDIFWFGEAPGAGTPEIILNGGVTNVSGIIQNMPLSTVNMFMKTAGSNTFNFNGNLIEMLHPQDSILQADSSVFTWNSSSTFNNTGIFSADSGRTVFNGVTTLNGTGSYQFYHLDINASKILTHNSPFGISIAGNFLKNGTFNAGSNEVNFNGIYPQHLNGTGIYTMYNVRLNNGSTAGVQLNVPMNITNHLQLDQGRLTTSDTYILSVNDNATASHGNSNSFINGPIIKAGNDAFIFPTGKNTTWGRIAINAPSSVNDQFKAEYFDTTYTDISPISSPLTSVSNLEFWELTRISGTFSPLVELFWENAASSAITNCGELSIASWNGASWTNLLSTASGTCSGNGNGSIISVAAVPGDTIFTYGFYSGVTTQNLDICNGDSIVVGTNVYSGTGTYLDVLQDINMNDSIIITNLHVIIPDTSITVNSYVLQSNNTNASQYQWIDCNNNYSPLAGETNPVFTITSNGSYALIVTENGCTDTSACYTIQNFSIGQNDLTGLEVYPNPFTRIINFSIPVNGIVEIFTVTGQPVYKKEVTGAYALEADLSSGIYMLRYTEGMNTKTFKLISR